MAGGQPHEDAREADERAFALQAPIDLVDDQTARGFVAKGLEPVLPRGRHAGGIVNVKRSLDVRHGRVYRGLSPLTGGKDHLSHRLVRKGATHRTAAILLWASSGLFALLAIGIYSSPNDLGTPLTYLSAAVWTGALVYFLRIPSED